MEIESYITTPFAENCYILKEGGEALVIDPGEATPEVLAAIEGFTVKTIINTHGHIDHVGGNAEMVRQTGAELVTHPGTVELLKSVPMQGQMFGLEVEESPEPNRFIDEGDQVEIGDTKLDVIFVPGHAPDHIALVGDGFVIGGDVLFQGSIGRTDLPGGSMDVLMNSIHEKFMKLPNATIVYSGHGPATTIGQERTTNPFVLGLV